MSPADSAIRDKRELTNRLIAAHDAAGLGAQLTDDVVLVAHDGPLFVGRDAVVAAFAGQFANPDFITYARTVETIGVSADGRRAAETGRWAGTWAGGVQEGGTYLAAWVEIQGQWRLERELYVALRG